MSNTPEVQPEVGAGDGVVSAHDPSVHPGVAAAIPVLEVGIEDLACHTQKSRYPLHYACCSIFE